MRDLNQILAILRTIRGALELVISKLEADMPASNKKELLFEAALSCIGKDVTPSDTIDDEVACAETVTTLINTLIPFPIVPGTWTLLEKLKNSPAFTAGEWGSGPGTIVLCATGTGNGSMRGHVGILSRDEKIMSNTSADGIWRENYTKESWIRRYTEQGGMQVHFFVIK